MYYNDYMKKNRIIEKLEGELSRYMVEETVKKDPKKRVSADIYKYRGLSLDVNIDSKKDDDTKTLSVKIGALEAEYKLTTGEKCGGSLYPEEERLIEEFFGRSDVSGRLRSILTVQKNIKHMSIIPFDLEEVYK